LATDLLDQDQGFQDFVIVHELLHLRYSNHGRMFKALMSAHVPGWRRFEKIEERLASLIPRPVPLSTRADQSICSSCVHSVLPGDAELPAAALDNEEDY